MGGGLAGTRDRWPILAPATWPLVPTGGDALTRLFPSKVILPSIATMCDHALTVGSHV